MTLDVIVAHAGADSLKDAIKSWGNVDPRIIDGNNGMLNAYQKGYETSQADILAYLHDDLIIHEPWIDQVLDQFEDEKVGLVGFGGAKIHGSPNLYKEPYNYKNLGRGKYFSNTDDAEVHGERFMGSTQVAVLDGYCLCIRKSILEHVNGWPVEKLDYIAYDYWISCIVRRLGYSCRLVGISCLHLGGRTAVALKKNFDPNGDAYRSAHKYIYNEFREVLPCHIK